MRDALAPIAGRLKLAVLFGSIARQADTATSDIDLLLVSDELTLEAVYGAVAPAEELLAAASTPRSTRRTSSGAGARISPDLWRGRSNGRTSF